MINPDVIKIEILADGTIKTTTDPVSKANHDSAESFLSGITRLAGGTMTRTARTDKKHVHHHSHDEKHVHN